PAHRDVRRAHVVTVLAQVGHHRPARLPARSRHANPLWHRQSFPWGMWARLAELPDGAFGGVGEGDAELVELGADLVGAGPVALLAGLGAVGDELLDGLLLLVGQVGERAAVL